MPSTSSPAGGGWESIWEVVIHICLPWPPPPPKASDSGSRGREVSQMAILSVLKAADRVVASSAQLFFPRGRDSDDICWGWRPYTRIESTAWDLWECVTSLCVRPCKAWIFQITSVWPALSSQGYILAGVIPCKCIDRHSWEWDPRPYKTTHSHFYYSQLWSFIQGHDMPHYGRSLQCLTSALGVFASLLADDVLHSGRLPYLRW